MPKRRANGEGTIEKLAPGKFRAVMKINGKRVCGPTCPSQSLALKELKEKLKKPRKATPTLSSYLHSEVEGPLRKELALKTWVLYEMIARKWIAPHSIGDLRLSEITPAEVGAWLAWISANVSARSAIRYLSFLKTMLRRAANQHLIEAQPWKGVKDPKTNPAVKTVMDAQTVKNLIDLSIDKRLRRFMILCAHGLRPSEACGLRGEDIRGGVMHIHQQAQDICGTVTIVPRTKSPQGKREVPLLPAFASDFAQTHGYLIATRKGTPCSTKEMGDKFRELVKDTDYAGIRPYDLRSSFGMMLLESGTDVRTAAEIMGHDPAMLAKVYARSRPELRRLAVAKAFGESTQESTQTA